MITISISAVAVVVSILTYFSSATQSDIANALNTERNSISEDRNAAIRELRDEMSKHRNLQQAEIRGIMDFDVENRDWTLRIFKKDGKFFDPRDITLTPLFLDDPSQGAIEGDKVMVEHTRMGVDQSNGKNFVEIQKARDKICDEHKSVCQSGAVLMRILVDFHVENVAYRVNAARRAE